MYFAPWACVNIRFFVALFLGPCLTLIHSFPKSSPRGWSAHDLRNPVIELDKCGRKGLRSNVCDPDMVIHSGEATRLDEEIVRLYNETACPCEPDICKARPGGFLVAVALVGHMRLDASDASMRDQQMSIVDKRLEAAKQFSYVLLKTWNLGRCNEDIIILYSRDDNVIYTVTNEKAKVNLTDQLIADIAMKSQIYFGANKYTNAEGLLHIINDYRSVLTGSYNTERSKQEAVLEGDMLHSAGSGITSLFVLFPFLFALVLLLDLQFFVEPSSILQLCLKA